MLGRLFGKSKDTSGEAVCAECGRTLLAGEWTQKIEGDDGGELLLCSLCGQAHPPADGDRLQVKSGAGAARPAGQSGGTADESGGPAEPERDENAALWKAIKDRDAQIESLRAELARGEAERQELLGRLARLQAAAPAPVTDQPVAPTEATADADELSEPAEAQGETEPQAAAEPDLFTPVDEAVVAPVDEASPEVASGPEVGPGVAAEDTAEILAADLPTATTPESTADASARSVTQAATEEEAAPEDEVVPEVDAEAEAQAALEAEAQAASMTLLQRGVDLLNVSPVPRKIAETNADLGIPTVHVGFDGETATVTFMWSMGWYRFAVDVETGGVSLGDRGYAERDDLQPNASVRADGTVQLAPARISRAAAQRAQSAPDEAAAPEPAAAQRPTEKPDAGVASPAEKADAEIAPPAGGPEILSKSLLGQRTDDERPSWEQTQARDFDWDH
jgi:hypothetical protein